MILKTFSPCDLAGVFGDLALCVVEVGRHGDDCVGDFLTQIFRGHLRQVHGVSGPISPQANTLFLTAPSSFAAKYDKNHRDAFMSGDADEGDLARKVHHELLMLP